MIVADAAILANAVGDDDQHGEIARHELRQTPDVAVPDLANVEATAVLRKRWIAGDLTDLRLQAAVAALAALPLIRYPTVGLLNRAIELRANVTPYDAVYVALAEALNVDLVTADRKLAAAPGPRCTVRIISPGSA